MSIEQNMVLVALVTIVLMIGHSVGRRTGDIAIDLGARYSLRRLQRAAAAARVGFAPSEVHCCGTTGIALDGRTGRLAVTCGRRVAVLEPAEVTGCCAERRSVFGRTWHYLRITTRVVDFTVAFTDAAVCQHWHDSVASRCRMPLSQQTATG